MLVGASPGRYAELASLLQFIAGWIASDPEHMTASLLDYAGDVPYGPGQLRLDLDRFASLLTAGNGPSLILNTGNNDF